MKNIIIDKRYTTSADISSIGFKLRDPRGEYIQGIFKNWTELRESADDGLGTLIKTVVIPHLQDIERLAPVGLSIHFMKESVDDLEPLPFDHKDEFDTHLDRADIK